MSPHDTTESSSNVPAKRQPSSLAPRSLYRDLERGKIGGVCSGVAQWTGVPVIVWRLAFLALFFGWGTGLGAYVVLWFLMDTKPEEERLPIGPADLDEKDREIWEAVKEEMSSLDLENDR